jgi:biopolymer transport protein ExbD
VQLRPRRERRPSEHVVPLINVVFLLLVFFMLTGRLAAPPALDLELPVDTSPVPETQASSTDETPPMLSIDADGVLALGARRVDPTELASALADPPELLALRADARVPARLLVPVLEQLEAAGISRIDLITERVGPDAR